MGKRKEPNADETVACPRTGNGLRRRVAIALCIAFFVVINMAVIFALSEEDREESGTRSKGVTAFVVRVIYPDYDHMSYDDQLAVTESAHRFVRKAAHFLEYALLGFLTSGLVLFLRRHLFRRKPKRWKTWICPAVFCFLYAVTDEVHQIFSDRGASPTDVLIDTLGAIAGILLIQLIVLIASRAQRKAKGEKRGGKGIENGEEDPSTLESEQEDPPCAPPDTI